MQNLNRLLAVCSLASFVGILGTAPVATAQAKLTSATQNASAKQSALPTFIRTQGKTAVRNFQDRQGLEVSELKAGTLLKVHSKSQGAYPFYEVSSPGGYPVWVFGQYLEQTDAQGVLSVNGNHVNQRPRPATDVNSMPLRTRLMAGDRVMMIKRQNISADWDSDWIQVWSPERTRAWVEVSQTTPVKDEAAAIVEWKANQRAIPKASVTTKIKPGPTEASGAKPQTSNKPVRPEAAKSLRYSDHLFSQAIANKDVSLDELQKVEDAYHRVLEMAPAGSTVREMTLQQLEKLMIHKNMAQLREEMRDDEAAKISRIKQLEETQRVQDLKQTASWGRFHARGWVESEKIDGEKHYFVRWDGGRQVELACGSGRYDLGFYEGYQIGVQGSTRRVATEQTLEMPATLRLIDVARIEVIAGSANLR